MLKGQKKHTDKEQGKTKHEAPRSVNYRATQNMNSGTTALDWSVVYTTVAGGGAGFKDLSLYKLQPGSRYNLIQKIHKKFCLHNGFLTQSMHLNENTKSNRSL